MARVIYMRNPKRGEAVEEWLQAGLLRPADSSTFEKLADEAHYIDTLDSSQRPSRGGGCGSS